MESCLTCRSRKVKCDGGRGVCARCAKLNIDCEWRDSPRRSSSIIPKDDPSGKFAVTQAGHKRLRISLACQTCREKKLKCDAGHPSCSTCLRQRRNCVYDPPSSTASTVAASSQQAGRIRNGSPVQLHEGERRLDKSTSNERSPGLPGPDILNGSPMDLSSASEQNRHPSMSVTMPLPTGHSLQPYLDSYLSNVHPICFQNILHPGVLLEGLEKAPNLLLLAICGSSAKFVKGLEEKTKGRLWIAEAKTLIMENLNNISTMMLVVLQTIALHDIHEADILSAWNLTSISIRMTRHLKLNRPFLHTTSTTFLGEECTRRLMWSVFTSDILLASDEIQISDEYVVDVGLPCNLWNFTQGTPCTTLRLHDDTQDISVHRATNPNGYLVRILALKREISTFILEHHRVNGELSWTKDSNFNILANKLERFRRSLPTNMRFEERHMYTFRSTKHLDMFLMIHIWYNQCGCDLFGIWQQGYLSAMTDDPSLAPPPDFFPKCVERRLYHARQISHLLGKVLKVEPDHLFRDPWITLSIWDSMEIQVAALSSNDLTGRNQVNEFIPLLKVNMRALSNTRQILALAQNTYWQCCKALRTAGLADIVLETADEVLGANGTSSPNHATIPLLRRYPFLQSQNQADDENWNNLFRATGFAADTTREASPEQQFAIPTRQSQPNVSATIPNNNVQNQPVEWDMSLDDEFFSWQDGDFSWDQVEFPESSALGVSPLVPGPSTDAGSQHHMDPFPNSLSPATQWNTLNRFDTAYPDT